MKLYFKGRYFFYNQGAGRYTIDYLYREQRPDYNDVLINTYELKNPKNFVVVEFDETKYPVESIQYDFENFYKPLFNLAELTKEQALKFVREEGEYKEVEECKFLVSEGNDELNIEPTYFTI